MGGYSIIRPFSKAWKLYQSARRQHTALLDGSATTYNPISNNILLVEGFATGSCASTTSRWCKTTLPKALDYCSHDTHVSLTSPCTDREAQQSTKCLDCVCELLPLHVWIEKRTSQLIILTVFSNLSNETCNDQARCLDYVLRPRLLCWITTKSKLTVEPHNVGGDTRQRVSVYLVVSNFGPRKSIQPYCMTCKLSILTRQYPIMFDRLCRVPVPKSVHHNAGSRKLWRKWTLVRVYYKWILKRHHRTMAMLLGWSPGRQRSFHCPPKN